MKRRLLAPTIALLSLTQHMAYADIITDLPNPAEDVIEESQAQTPSASQTESDKTHQRQYTGEVNILEISRKSGGEVRKVILQQPLSLLSFEILVKRGRVQVHEVTLITTSGLRVDARELRQTPILETAVKVSSGNLHLREAIAAIEIRAESHQIEADLGLSAVSETGIPKMTSTMSTKKTSEPATTPESAVIRVGDTVNLHYGNNDYVGTVLEIIQSKRAKVRFKGYSETSIIDLSQLSRAINCSGTLCVGKRVLFVNGNNSYAGTVKAVFANGRVEVKFDGYELHSFIIENRLSETVNCIEDLCLGNRVLFNNGMNYFRGTVREIFANRKASVRFDGYDDNVQIDVSILFKTTERIGNYRSGIRIIYNNGNRNYLGVIREVFRSGLASIKFDEFDELTYINVKNLGLEINCDNTFCTGARVNFQNRYFGTIVKIYSNGFSLVNFESIGREFVRTSLLKR